MAKRTCAPYVQADRALIRACARILETEPIWNARPLRSTIDLVISLNALTAWLANRRYDEGLPRPSEVQKHLRGIHGLATRACRTGRGEPLLSRITALYERSNDAVHILQGMLREHPVFEHELKRAHNSLVHSTLESLYLGDPAFVKGLTEEALSLRYDKALGGRGGKRAKPDTIDRALIEYGALIFRDFTDIWMIEGSPEVPKETVTRFHDLMVVLFDYFEPGLSRETVIDRIRRHFPDRAKPLPPKAREYGGRKRAGKYS